MLRENENIRDWVVMKKAHRKSSLQQNQNLLAAGYSLRNKQVNNVDLNSYQLDVPHFNLKFVCCEKEVGYVGVVCSYVVWSYTHIFLKLAKFWWMLIYMTTSVKKAIMLTKESYQYLRSQNASLFTFPVLKNVAPKTK